MPYRYISFFNIVQFLVDLFLLNLSYIICSALFDQLWYQLNGKHFYSLLYQFNVCWLLIVFYTKYYAIGISFIEISRKTLRVIFQFAFLVILSIFLMKFQYASRLFFFTFISLLVCVILIWKYIFILLSKYHTLFQVKKRKAIFIGSGSIIDKINEIFSNDYFGFELSGVFSDETTNEHVYGKIDEIQDFIHNHNITTVFSSIMPTQHRVINNLALTRDMLGIRLVFVPDFKLYFKSDVTVQLENNLAFISFRKEPLEDLYNSARKIIFDIVLSLFILALFSWWLFPLIGLLIKLTSKGPILFKQLRSGRLGQPFLCYKFRTMESDPSATQAIDGSTALRISRIGCFLRKTSLDEFPQFINVLLGHMSVVGPRPHMLKDTDEYRLLLETYMVRLYLKPGITGLAQISGHRGKLSFTEMKERLKWDIYYMEHWGFWLDIQIILKTVWLVLKGDPKAN